MPKTLEQDIALPQTKEELAELEQALLAHQERVLQSCSNEETILRMFPSRCKEPVREVVSADGKSMGPSQGLSDVKGRRAAIPCGDTTFAREVRAHEAGHLNLPIPPRAKLPQGLDMVDQAVEDMLVEFLRHQSPVTVVWSAAVALRDVHRSTSILSNLDKVPPMTRDQLKHLCFVEALRGAVKLYAASVAYSGSSERLQNAWRKGRVRLERHEDLKEAAFDCIRLLMAYRRTRRYTTRALNKLREDLRRTLTALFELPPPPPPPLPPPRSRGIEPLITTVDLTQGGNVRLVLAEVHENKKVGIRLRPNALVSAALNPMTAKPFVRIEKLPGASVLIDASGSMSLTSQAIVKLIEAYPASTVAYYCGEEGGPNGKAYMVLCAKDGRVTRETKLPHIEAGGNEIDYSALVWLLRQDAPRYFITDGGFCGGMAASATYLFKRAIAEGKITWINRTDVQAAIAEVKA